MRLSNRGGKGKKLTMGHVAKRARRLYYLAKAFTEGYGIRAKIRLIPNTAYQVFHYIAGSVIAGTTAHVAERVSCGLTMKFAPEVILKNRNGMFKCRKGSGDIGIVGEACEIDLTNYFTKVRSGVFVDVGAHIGRYTIKMARQIGDKGKVIAIEADPENYKALVDNIKLNRVDNVYAFNVACCDKEEDVKLFIQPLKHSVFSSIKLDVLGKSDRTIMVNGNTLDNILNGLGIDKINVVKIDVEGAEKEVLLGMKEAISRNNDIEILFEAWNSSYLGECRKVLQDYGLVVEDKEIDSTVYRARKVV